MTLMPSALNPELTDRTKSTEKEIYHDEPDERFPDDYC